MKAILVACVLFLLLDVLSGYAVGMTAGTYAASLFDQISNALDQANGG